MQEDLEAEFQSLFSLLEELKEGMLMKIKQDRASRTYELQVCVGNSPGPPLRRHPHCTPQTRQSPSSLMCFSKPAPFPASLLGDTPKCPEPDTPMVLVSPPLPLVSYLYPPWFVTQQCPTHLLSLLIPCPVVATATPTHLVVPPSCPHPAPFSALPIGSPHQMARHHPLPHSSHGISEAKLRLLGLRQKS